MTPKLITKETLLQGMESKFSRGEKIKVVEPVHLRSTKVAARHSGLISGSDFNMIHNSQDIVNKPIRLSGNYDSGYDVPLKDGLSWNDLVRTGKVDLKSSNSLNENWRDYMDATRYDLTIRKQAKPTIRQTIYNIVSNPGFSKDVRPSELNPYAFVFKENNGTGQSIKQGENLGGSDSTIPLKIYATGFTHTLLAELFDNSYDATRMNDGVAVAESAKKDDLAITPILNGTYAGAKATAASAEGDNRQEKLINTLMDAVDDLSERKDPKTGREIGMGDMVLLCNERDASHVSHVLGGLPSDRNRSYGPISSISTVVGYNGETITLDNETVAYTGVTAGTCYLIKKNRYMNIPVKLGLTMEMDNKPDIPTLAREERAWYFVEGLQYSEGVLNFVQEVTLPTW